MKKFKVAIIGFGIVGKRRHNFIEKHPLLETVAVCDVRFLDKKFWMDSSDSLMYQGTAKQLSFTQSARMPAFFEHSNVNLPQYA